MIYKKIIEETEQFIKDIHKRLDDIKQQLDRVENPPKKPRKKPPPQPRTYIQKCKHCNSDDVKLMGWAKRYADKKAKGARRFHCQDCRRTFIVEKKDLVRGTREIRKGKQYRAYGDE